MRALVLVAALLLLSIGAFVLWHGANFPASPPDGVAIRPAERLETRISDATALEVPTGAGDAPEMAAVERKSEHVPVAIAPVDLEAKYRDWSLERLEGAKTVVDSAERACAEAIFDERLKSGLFEEAISGPGESHTFPEFKRPARFWTESIGDGRTRNRSIEIPDGEYPAFEALREEQRWLWTRIRSLQAPKQR